MCRRIRGFTILELVVTILLISIVGAVSMSRLTRSDALNAVLVRDQILSTLRSAQQKAIGRSNVTVLIRPLGDELELTVEAEINGSSELVQTDSAPGRSVHLGADVNELDSCSVTPGAHVITETDPLRIEYDALGNLLRGGVTAAPGYPESVESGLRICVDGNAVASVCISRAGYAYAGDCND